jgi:hypothetical protein
MKKYFKIPTKIYDHIFLDDGLSKNEIQVLLVIARLTFGLNKEKTMASIRYIASWIKDYSGYFYENEDKKENKNKNICSISIAINKLIKKGILNYEWTTCNGRKTRVLFFNNNYLQHFQ